MPGPGALGRRGLLRILGSALALPLVRQADAKDYALPEEVLSEIDRLESEVDARLRAIRGASSAAGAFVASVIQEHERHRADRARLARRLRLPRTPYAPGATADDRSLAGLRVAQEALMHAHAEGLPALRDAPAVDLLARHMVVASTHLTIIDLWIEREEQLG